jgi:ABC-2 type transport system ATP-binding protein
MKGSGLMGDTPAILAEGLIKSYGKARALDGVNLKVETGSVLGILGPNGAGKSTMVRILTTLLTPDGGRAQVAGYDVVKQAAQARAQIGLTGQFSALDDMLTGYENLVMFGQLAHLSGGTAKRRVKELIQRFDLTEAAKRLVRTYSGGMRRRLDLAASLIMAPPVLFLDEPTTGLDPRGRHAVWELIEELAHSGATIFLTTQYLEEADQLAQRIAVVDRGRVIADGTVAELKAQIGGESLEITLTPNSDLEAAQYALRPYTAGEIRINIARRFLTAPLITGSNSAERLAAITRDLSAARVDVEELALRRPTLDDVFFTLTGSVAPAPTSPADGINTKQKRDKANNQANNAGGAR